MKKRLLVIASLAILIVGGCALTQQTDTQAEKAGKITAAVGDTAEAASQIAAMVSLLWPPAAGLALLFTGVAGTAKKLQPKIKAAKDEAALLGVTLEEVVRGVELLKKENPDAWNILKSKIAMQPESKTVISDLKPR